MGWRFRRSLSVLPGVRLNFGLRSGSISFGPRGLHYTIGTQGSRITAGIPGTGLYWTQKLNPPWSPQQSRQLNQSYNYGTSTLGAQASPIPKQPSYPPSQFGQPTQQPTNWPNAGGVPQPSANPITHVFIPFWMVWATLSAIGIGSLCIVAATFGHVIR
jgi:hypothetical protein